MMSWWLKWRLHIDNFIMAGNEEIDELIEKIKVELELSLVERENFRLIGLDIKRDEDDSSIVLMKDYAVTIHEIRHF